jgi:selenophosphate synthetase-related protein
MRNCLLSLAIREMQVKTIRRYHLTPLEGLLTTTKIVNAGKDVQRKGTLTLLMVM